MGERKGQKEGTGLAYRARFRPDAGSLLGGVASFLPLSFAVCNLGLQATAPGSFLSPPALAAPTWFSQV